MCKWFVVAFLFILAVNSNFALAEYPNWDYLELSHAQVEIDDNDNSSFNVYSISMMVSINENYLLTANYLDDWESNDWLVSADFRIVSVGGGYQYEFNQMTSLYSLINYEYIEAEVNNSQFSEYEDDAALGATIGIKSMINDSIELNSSLGYTGLEFLDNSNVSFRVSAFYYFKNKFSIGLGYRTLDTIDVISASLRFSF